VRDEVLKNTRNRQEPFVYSSLGGEDLSLVPAAPAPGPATNMQAEGRRDYELAAQIGTKEVWEQFLTVYNTGFYATLARAALNKIVADEARAAAAAKAETAAKSSIVDILQRLSQAKHLVDTFAISTQLGTATRIAPKGQGRPGSNYVLPVIELMNLWEGITGKKTVTPRNAKGKNGRLEGFQPSTRFIQIGLSMVDNAATSSEANTAIRRVLELRKQNEGSSLKDIYNQIKNSA
jgi:hypothetical protein